MINLEKNPQNCRLCKKCIRFAENGCRMVCDEEVCKFGLYGVPCCIGFRTTDPEFAEDPIYRECGVYVGDEPLPEFEPSRVSELPEPQHPLEFYRRRKSESDTLTKNS